MHGDKIPSDWDKIQEETLIIGHEHPSVGIRSGERIEKIKCFLAGEFRSKNIIVMPSFNFITEGSDVLNEKSLSLLNKTNWLIWKFMVLKTLKFLFWKNKPSIKGSKRVLSL